MRALKVVRENMHDTILMPHSPETEEQVLATALMYPEVAPHVVASLGSEDFYNASNKKIFYAINQTVVSGELVGPQAVCHRLRQAGDLDAVGGFNRVFDLYSAASTPLLIDTWLGRVKKFSALRGIVRLGHDLTSWTGEEDEPDVLVARARGYLDGLIEKTAPVRRKGLGPSVDRVIERMLRLRASGELPGYRTGYTALDDLIGGLQPGKQIVVGARSGMGKTHLLVDLTVEVASQGIPVGIISLETSEDSFTTRMLANVSHVNNKALSRGYVGQHEVAAIRAAGKKIADLPVTIVERDARRVAQMEKQIRGLVAQGAKVIGLDNIQLLQAEKEGVHKQAVVERAAQKIKELALELNVPIIVLSQLNREAADGKPPELIHLKDAGIEADADVVILIHRDEYYDKTKNPSEAQLIVAKHRDGETGELTLYFNGGTSSFHNTTDQLFTSQRPRLED